MSNAEVVFNVARELILELKDAEEHEITPQTRIDALELDSLDFVEMQVVIKKRFAATLDPELFVSGRIATLGQMCDYIVESAPAAVPA